MADNENKTSSIWDLPEYKPYLKRWQERINAVKTRQAYCTGRIYDKAVSRFGGRLKSEIKPLYLPLDSAVEIDAGLIPGGWQLVENTPIDIYTACKQLLKWSRWKTDGVLYVYYGAQRGLTGLKIVEYPEKRIVTLDPVSPARFMVVENGIYDPSPGMSFYVDFRYGPSGEKYEYAEVITPEVIRTYKNGELFGYGGREDPETLNENGFIPYVEVKHITTGDPLSEATFEKTIPMLNEVNETATQLGDIIQKHNKPQWAVSGADPSDLDKGDDVVWFFPEGAEAKALVANINIRDVLEFVREIAGNVKGALPESAWEELQKRKQLATETLEIQLYPLVIKIKHRCRPNYDDGLERAFRLAGEAGARLGIDEISILADDSVEIDPDRPVLPMDPLTELQIQNERLALAQNEQFYRTRPGGFENAPEGGTGEAEAE